MTRSFSARRGATRILFGKGASRDLGPALDDLGVKKVLIVCTPGRADSAAALGATLGERFAHAHAHAREHVPASSVDEARVVLAASGADAVVGLGGGSAIGLAKAVAREVGARLIAVPTTYSGSEMTSIYGITTGGVKRTAEDERARPSIVVYDTERFATLPRGIALASLWNAMAHAVEALWMNDADRAVLALAEDALRLLASGMRRLAAGHDDDHARDEAIEGAYLAGAALSDAGTGLHHKLCHVLGGTFGLPHADTHAAMLPHVVRFQRDAAPEAMSAIARALGVVDPVGALSRLAQLTFVKCLSELGLPREALGSVVEAVLASPRPSPRPLDREGLTTLLEAAWAPTAAAPLQPRLRGPERLATLSGFGGVHESEALPEALPRRQNAPRLAPYGLIPELLNGTPFTVHNTENSRVWMYRARASFGHGTLHELAPCAFLSPFDGVMVNRMRWAPREIPAAHAQVDFVDGLATLGGAGDPVSGPGYLVHLYAANADMQDRAFSSADGDLLLVPQAGTLECRTELGWLRVPPGSVAIIPRGLKFAIGFAGDGGGRGWMLEVFGRRLRLPERGLIGSNGLADARHFVAPVASYEDRACSSGFQIVTKLGGRLFEATQSHSAFDVVAWHGNHVPYSYDLSLFAPMTSAKVDHPDPSILTVLTAPLDDHGRAICDFVAFPGRWDVVEHSFRPPFMHRNAATEINGVVFTSRPEHGYDPGCTFLSPALTAHGVSTATYDAVWDQSEEAAEGPRRLPDTSLWIMFESALAFQPTVWARRSPLVDAGFTKMFEGLRSRFDPERR